MEIKEPCDNEVREKSDSKDNSPFTKQPLPHALPTGK